MNAIGIVAEYNPFHTGHAYQIDQSRAMLGQDRPVVAVMSGNWVQQADCAIADKWTRARLALMGGADLVLELPTVYATASAEQFARGAVEILNATGVVEYLSFGSEGGDVAPLAQLAKGLDSQAYASALRPRLDSGEPFAVCRQNAMEEVVGRELSALLSTPNNNLGIEYIRALNALNSPIRPVTVRREGAAHNAILGILGTEDSTIRPPRFRSATEIRANLLDGRWDLCAPYLVPGGRNILERSPVSLPGMERLERAILMKMRTMTAQDWAALPDSGAAEGLPYRLEKAGQQCRSTEEFFQLTKTKRFTHARLRRLVMWAMLGLTADRRLAHPPYIRVLGFNPRGQALLGQMRKSAALPVITKPAHIRKLDGDGQALFDLESRCTDLYDLCLKEIPAPGREWRTDPVRIGG